MIDLENAQAVAPWAAIRISVQPRAQDHKLAGTALNRGGQGILREARSRRDEDSHPPSGWALFSFPSDRGNVFAEDTQGQRIGKDATVFQHLMGGAMEGCRSGRPARLSGQHTPPV